MSAFLSDQMITALLSVSVLFYKVNCTHILYINRIEFVSCKVLVKCCCVRRNLDKCTGCFLGKNCLKLFIVCCLLCCILCFLCRFPEFIILCALEVHKVLFRICLETVQQISRCQVTACDTTDRCLILSVGINIF